MAFSNEQIAEFAEQVEKLLWSKRRPPLHLRDKVREGQRIEGNSVELFLVRPRWNDPTQQIEESIAKATFVKRRNVCKVYWKRADMKWHSYSPNPEVDSLAEFLAVVDEDANCCFWG